MTTRSISIIDSQAMKFYIITGLLVVLISAICTTTAAVPLGNYGIGVSTKQRWAYDGCAPGANGNAVPKVGDACELFGARPGICRKKLTNILPNQPSLECVQAGCRSSQYQQFEIGCWLFRVSAEQYYQKHDGGLTYMRKGMSTQRTARQPGDGGAAMISRVNLALQSWSRRLPLDVAVRVGARKTSEKVQRGVGFYFREDDCRQERDLDSNQSLWQRSAIENERKDLSSHISHEWVTDLVFRRREQTVGVRTGDRRRWEQNERKVENVGRVFSKAQKTSNPMNNKTWIELPLTMSGRDG
ncbi:hypothetical protein F5878DRAFT_636994 [Lentinula raphanica]|uniref:Uncharacterized protein n=1 Tax=Lentinula raphanica TaxID=153919 RepID=A0AA38UK86_9AGAR|nr:hypothetical protein F5878DRAFT_636994 [Lentinula raphanica]